MISSHKYLTSYCPKREKVIFPRESQIKIKLNSIP